jgi:hypothetical protein
MKTTLSFLVVSLLLGAAWTASASDDNAKDKSSQKDKPAALVKTEKKTVATKDGGKEDLTTGTYLKQKVRRSGMITDGSSQVLVVDRINIERSGASTVSQVLNRYGAR